MQSPTFGLDKNKELFRSFMVFEGLEQQTLAKTKSAKKIKSNHTRTQSFKSPSSTKFRGLQTIDQFLGIKKPSLKKPLKTKEMVQELHQNSNFLSNQRFLVSSTVGSPTGIGLMGNSNSMSGLISGQERSPLLNFSGIATRQSATSKNRLKQVADAADLTSKIVKLSSLENDKEKFEHAVLQMLYNYSDSSITIAKAEMVTILKYIFSFYNQKVFQSAPTVPAAIPQPRKRAVCIQSDPLDMEGYKHTAKRLIVNSDLKPPEDSFDNNMVLLFQKEILLDEILTILNEEDIDLNNLLSITLERIEANFYEPPADMSMNDGVDLTLEDKMKMPTPKGKLADPSLKNRLMIDLTKIDLQESDSEQTKQQIQPRGQAKLGNHGSDEVGQGSEEVQHREAGHHQGRVPGAQHKKLASKEHDAGGQRPQNVVSDHGVGGHRSQTHGQDHHGYHQGQTQSQGDSGYLKMHGFQQNPQLANIISQQKGVKSAANSSQSIPGTMQHLHHSELHKTTTQGMVQVEGPKVTRAADFQARPGMVEKHIDFQRQQDKKMRSQLNSANREQDEFLVQTPKEYDAQMQHHFSRGYHPEADQADFDDECDELALELELGELPDESQQSRGPAEEASFLSSGRRGSQVYEEHPSKLAGKESKAQSAAMQSLKEHQKKGRVLVPKDAVTGGDLMSGGGGTTTGLDEPGKSLPKKGKLDKLFSRGSLEGAVVDKWSA